MPVFQEVQFPSNISRGSSGGASFSTAIIESKNGAEQRNINWNQPRLRFNIASRIKDKTNFDIVNAFFYAQKGRAIGFRFKDWSDYQLIGEIIGVGDGTATEFQIIKTYISGAVQTIRDIKKPVAGTLNIYLDGVLQIADVTTDITTGIVTFTTAPTSGALVSIDCEYDVPVRFDTDNLEVIYNSQNSFEVQDVAIIEVKI